MIVDLLRHGELEGGIKYRGRTDDPLTTAGLQAMTEVWQQLQPEVELIISSPLSRCRLPAGEWAKEASIPHIEDIRVSEMFYGAWEGLTREEIEADFPGMLQQWRSHPESMSIPEAETLQQLQARIIEFWNELCDTYQDKHLLIVAHSGSMRMLLANALNAPLSATRRLQMPYACWSRIVVKPHTTLLDFHNRQP